MGVFVAIDQFGVKVNPFDMEEIQLRILSRNKKLFCPECKKLVRFASGEKVTAHFKHVNNPDCRYNSEPETEEHMNGKMLIRNWLVNLFPNAQVEFEYKIQETNQRADVIVIFPDGKKFAFEMQCSRIQRSVWKERHLLYQKAGIKDFWILGESIHKYGKTDEKVDKEKHQLFSLASAIYEEEGAVLFLDTTTATIKGLYKHKYKGWHSDTILLFNEETFSLKDAKIFKNYIGTDSIRDDFKVWYYEKLKEEQLIKIREEAEKREQKRRKIEFEQFKRMREKRKQQFLNEHKSITLKKLIYQMTQNEKRLFVKLLKKHEYIDENFPGVFKVYTDYNYMIQTPFPLWQLWVYDKFIYLKNKPYDKVWIPKIIDEFYKMRKEKVFRFKVKDGNNNFSFAIYDYIGKLNQLNIVEQLGVYTTKYHQIIANELPPYSGKELHNSVVYYLSFSDDSWSDENDMTDEDKDLFKLYKDMIKEYQDIKPQNPINESIHSTLEYTRNLLLAKPELGNDWELEFILNLNYLVQNGYSISEKQERRARTIVERIEKILNISLTIND